VQASVKKEAAATATGENDEQDVDPNVSSPLVNSYNKCDYQTVRNTTSYACNISTN
jgi:hypothetical protein